MCDDTRSILANATKVGHGATADVYRVEDPIDGTVAWKVSNTKPNSIRRLLQEAALMKRIGAHPHVATLLGTCEVDGKQVLIMDYAAGGSLASAFHRSRSPISMRTIKIIVWQLLQAVQHLHAAGLLHRDVKLENVLLRHECPEGRLDRVREHDIHVVLADMGFVCAEQDTRTIPWQGTLCATAPESLRAGLHPGRGSYSFASDVWSVGIIAYELLCRNRPFAFQGPPDIVRQRTVDAVLRFEDTREEMLSAIASPGARDFVSRLLHPDPARRFTVVDALDHPWLGEANLAGLQQRRDETVGYAMVVGGGLQHNHAEQAALQDLPAIPVNAVDLSDESEDRQNVDLPRVAAPAEKKVLPNTAWVPSWGRLPRSTLHHLPSNTGGHARTSQGASNAQTAPSTQRLQPQTQRQQLPSTPAPISEVDALHFSLDRPMPTLYASLLAPVPQWF